MMKQAKRYFVLCLMAMVSVVAMAIPAKPGLTRNIQLTDGTTITARLIGDEHGHYWLGSDGKAYSVNSEGVATTVDAEAVKAKAQVRRSKANAQRAKRLAPRKVGSVGSITGQKKGLIILVNFTDTTFKAADNNALYQRIANEENFSYGNFKGSMYDYFKAQSDGQFLLNFDVVGPYTVSSTHSYYGSNDSQGNDKYPAEMVIEALKLADNDVNYADYDWDGDGEVEQVYVVYAGKGEADGGAATTIWPHEWTLSDAAYYGDGKGAQTLDGVKIDTYACGGELNGYTGSIAGIGTMCHEFSHCLGYPDFYDTDYSGGQGMFEWDLMDSGSYNGDGYQPAGYTSYERWVAGWATPTELTATQQVSNMPDLQSSGQSYVIYNPGNSNEYFLLENRQKQGWDSDIPGSGLLILHVDYDATVWNSNEPNDDPSHQRMTWIAADNEYQYTTYQGTKYYTTAGAANDPFPYGNVNSFSATSTPAASLFNTNTNTNTNYLDSSVEEITQNSDGTVSFKFVGLSNVATPTFSPAAGRYSEAQTVTITCTTSGATIYYTLDGTTPTTSSNVYSQPLTISETTTVKAIAVADGEESATATAKYTIGASVSDPNTKTFRRVSSVDDLESGMRYIIACGSKATAAGSLSSTYLTKQDVTVSSDVITITSDVAVFVLEGDQTNGWTFQNESTNQYLYSTAAKSVKYSSDEKTWTLADGTGGVIMTYGNYGTMLYNNSATRFTTYTSDPSTSMIQANLYMEESDGTTPTTPDPTIVTEDALTFSTTVGTPQTLPLEVLSEGLTEDITLTLADQNNAFSLGQSTIASTEEDATVNVTFNPATAGTYTATITLASAGAESVTVTLTGTATEATTPDNPTTGDGDYVKVTEEPSDWSGTYLIVYDDGSVAMNGGLETLDAIGNTIEVTIDNNTIASTAKTDAASFTIEKVSGGYTIKSASGYYIGQTSNANGLASSNSNAYTNTLSLASDGVDISTASAYLRYNSASNQTRFRYYKSSSYTGQKAIQLYRKSASSGTEPGGDEPEPLDLEGNGTMDSPYTVADVNLMYANSQLPTEAVYVQGIVSEIVTEGTNAFSTTYGNMTYYISDDGTTTDQFYIYRGYNTDNAKFTSADQLQEGDAVVVYGTLIVYTSSSGATTNEMQNGNYLVSLERPAVTLDPSTATVVVEGTVILTATVENADGATVTWESSDESVATLSDGGVVTAVAVGTATITASITANGHTYSATCEVTVTLPVNPDDPTTGEEKYELVTDASTLAAGDKILIAYVNDDAETHVVLSTTQNNNNRAATTIVPNEDGTLTPTDDTQVITLEQDGTYFLFNVGDGYLYAASSSKNYLRTKTDADANAKATITISSGSATITFQGSNTRNTIRYNSDNGGLFSCYSGTTTGSAPQIYRKVASQPVASDVDGDGDFDEADLEIVVKILIGRLSANDYPNADIDGENGVTLSDITRLVNLIKAQSAE